MRERGIDVSRVVVDPTVKTGVTVAITSPSDRALVSFLGSIDALTGADISGPAFHGFDHLHISSYFMQDRLRPAIRGLFAEARRRGLTTSLDPGFDPSHTWGSDLRDTLQEVDLFFPNEVELSALSGSDDPEEGVRRLQNGRTRIVAKLGSHGAMSSGEEGVMKAPAFPVEALDTTGAGDSFDAGFLHAWLQGEPLLECLRFGAACGALSTLGLGGTARQPSLDEALAFLTSQG